MRGTWVLLALCACDQTAVTPDAAPTGDGITIDEPGIPGDAPDPNMPATLADTGLCADAGCTQINTGIHTYTPRFELYSDTATKRRWIHLPPGTTIDTSDMDQWSFPVGTKLWKEFTRGGTRVETRLIMRVGDAGVREDWFYAAYVWNAAQDATVWAEFGEQDANGTQHDVPGKAQCWMCHENNKPSRVLGFSALQLDIDGQGSDLDLADLVAANLLSTPPTANGGGPFFPLDAAAEATVWPALGYLHANCGHCHNPSASLAQTQIRLRVPITSVGDHTTTPTYTTVVGQTTLNTVNGHDMLVARGDASMSVLIDRFTTTGAGRMPAAGSEFMDADALPILQDWINDIPP